MPTLGKMVHKKRIRKRVAKEDRKNLRGWAEGAREAVLIPHMDAYEAALDQGWRQERKVLKMICLEFHGRIDWRTEDHQEPAVKSWDPAAPVVPETLSDEEAVCKRQRIKALNARIRRWFKYRIRRLRKIKGAAGLDPSKNPYAVLLAKLSGVTAPPKARQAYQQFMNESYTEKIAPVVAERWEAEREQRAQEGQKSGKEPKAGFRAKVARDVFAALPSGERKDIADRAKKLAADAKAAYLKALKEPPPQDPASRQACIRELGPFMGPILEGIQAYTGLHSTLIVGGPMPAYGGELRTTHVSFGRNRTSLAQHWPQWDKGRFATNVQNFMIEYLHTVFTSDDCAKASPSGSAPTASASSSGGADLSGAQYTIASGVDDSDSESDSDSSDSSDSDSDSESDEDEEEEPPRKKAKVSKPAAASAEATFQSSAGKDYEELRNRNIAQTAAAAAELKAAFAGVMQDMQGGQGGRPKPKAKVHKAKQLPVQPAPATRRSTRRTGGASEVDIEMEETQEPSERDEWMEFLDSAPTTTTSTSELPTPASGLATAPLATSTTPVTPATAPASTATDASASTTPAGTASSELPASTVPPASTAPSDVPASASTTPTSAPSSKMPISTATSAMPVINETPTTATVASTEFTERTTLMACPAKAPSWFVDGRAVISKVDLGCHFDALIAAWTRIEYASRFEHGPTNLSAKLRPRQVGIWISGRRAGVPPKVTDVTAFSEQWGKWWDSLQPTWRKKDVHGKWEMGQYGEAGKEWGPLYQWGVNGTLSLLVSLYCWGCAVVDEPELRAAWEEALEDVGWMLEGMATFYEMFRRRF
ncbi:hypothetical protein FB451DRAFT_1196827 [Mycena latifolia]|nr:hypothetical protein FB451DRAFT_1196827 [Mycena latifolia]